MPTDGINQGVWGYGRMIVGLHLDTAICRPHQCQHCEADIDPWEGMRLVVRGVGEGIVVKQP